MDRCDLSIDEEEVVEETDRLRIRKSYYSTTVELLRKEKEKEDEKIEKGR